MKKKFKANNMQVQSFVTSFDTSKRETVEMKGGGHYACYTTPYYGCYNWTKPFCTV